MSVVIHHSFLVKDVINLSLGRQPNLVCIVVAVLVSTLVMQNPEPSFIYVIPCRKTALKMILNTQSLVAPFTNMVEL